MKKILTLFWFSSLLAACGSVPPSLTPDTTNPPVITATMAVQPTVTLIPVTAASSTASNTCGRYGPGRRVFLDELPAFAVREGPGCNYEAIPGRLNKPDPLLLFDVLGRQADWLLVDLCNDRQGWIFAPAIDDTNIDFDEQALPVLTPPAPKPAAPATLTPEASREAMAQARETLIRFFDLLYQRNYQAARDLFAGGYGNIIMWNPDADPQDYATLLERACERDDFQCFLRLKRVVKGGQVSAMEYQFTVEFLNDDGTLYQRRSGEGEERMSQFSFRVVRDCDGRYMVVDWPFYPIYTGG